MRFRKFISLWVLLALMLGQVALAQHSASHIEHGFSQETVASNDIHNNHNHNHDKHNHDKDNKKHECPECLLTKSLQTAFYNAPITLNFSLQAEAVVFTTRIPTVFVNHYNSNTPRAPPTVLI